MLYKVSGVISRRDTFSFALFFLLSGCSSSPYFLNDYLQAFSVQARAVTGEGYIHRWLPSPALQQIQQEGKKPALVTIYLEGDGQPYLPGGTLPADDPTPANLPALRMMSKDKSPSIYLGRPCYFQPSAKCSTQLWTGSRYSEEVVASLETALLDLKQKYQWQRLRLVGYSGGGVLAVLLASRLEDVESVVTVAANLDVSAWLELHDYQAMPGSLNPANTDLAISASQWHFLGEDDENVPPGISAAYINRNGGKFEIVEGQNHSCCWYKVWPGLINQVDSEQGL